jgi:3-isopropylmalate/(R)-2-methylmalate dehydratase small subunit
VTAPPALPLLCGRARVCGRDVTTDHILPGRYLDRSYDEVGQFAMAGLDETFASRTLPGDIIVAGPNFGCGSSREAAVIALKAAGVAAVVAPSFGGIFFRNAITQGLVPVVVDDTGGIAEGDPLEVDLARRVLRHLRPGAALPERPIRNLTGTSLEILRAGGLLPYVRRRLAR